MLLNIVAPRTVKDLVALIVTDSPVLMIKSLVWAAISIVATPSIIALVEDVGIPLLQLPAKFQLPVPVKVEVL